MVLFEVVLVLLYKRIKYCNKWIDVLVWYLMEKWELYSNCDYDFFRMNKKIERKIKVFLIDEI